MNKTTQTIFACIFICIITFSLVYVAQIMARSARMDVTERKLYTLTEGTKNIIHKLTQPITMKLFYAKTAANEGPDGIQFYNEYAAYVKSLLAEYQKISNGKIKLEVIDPRPYSTEEEDALRYGLTGLNITQEERFFFGLVVSTEFGQIKTIEIFKPDRKQFIEYDISSLIESAITREKKRLGILSSLPITGDDDYAARMKQMQGQPATPSWHFVTQLRQQYDVTNFAPDAKEISRIDMLLVIHPKSLSQETLFAIDQYVVTGGKIIVCADPHSIADPAPQGQIQMRMLHKANSDLNTLLNAWGVNIAADTFAADTSMSPFRQITQRSPAQPVIVVMNATQDHVNKDNQISAQLNQLEFIYPGAVVATEGSTSTITPLISTTVSGNTWHATSFDIMGLGRNPDLLKERFTSGTQPVVVAAMVTDTFKSAFPDGITIPAPAPAEGETAKEPEVKTGVTKASEEGVLVVVADVDFLSDQTAFQQMGIFGISVRNDNAALLQNALDQIIGSTDLLSIRSRGNYERPLKVIQDIEAAAEQKTASKVAELQERINGINQKLTSIMTSQNKNDGALINKSIHKEIKKAKLEQIKAQKDLRAVQNDKRVDIESLQNKAKLLCILGAPSLILLFAIILSISNATKRRNHLNTMRIAE